MHLASRVSSLTIKDDTEAMNDQVLTWANAGCLVSVPAPALLMFRSWQLLSSFLLR